ncbi:sarcosine oxidase subunit gamma family protein [Pseudohaliea sp.]|uniref:sarcosine oxidase subunit gamma n=1 Tax=Pseudohaliea sp. TaxID=2740289 RepID=UPI0032EBF14D
MADAALIAPEEGRVLRRAGFTAAERTVGLVRVQIFSRATEAEARFSEQLQLRLPGPRQAIEAEGMQWCWSAPGEWVVSVPVGTEAVVIESLRSRCGDFFAVLNVITDSRVCLHLSGTNVRELLARGCTVDFHPDSFCVGHCASTRFADIPVMVLRPGEDGDFLLYVDSSYGDYLFKWLEAASRDC